MNRPISIVGILQVLVIVLGFIALGIHMKFLGYPTASEYVFRFSPLALFLREYGMYLLLVPPLWMALAVFSSPREHGILSLPAVLLQGVVIILILLCTFLYAAMCPGSRVMVWFAPVSPPASQQGQPPPAQNP